MNIGYEVNIISVNNRIRIHKRINKRNIYRIYRLIFPNGKMYIGQTKQSLGSRWNNGNRYSYNTNLYADICRYGWNNIRKELISYASNSIEADELEVYFIEKFNTMNPDNGYNLNNGGRHGLDSEDVRKKKSISHFGLKESIETKRKKSNKVIAIKENVLYICDSGKLLGDYIGTTKDYVKSCLRRPCLLYGYQVYYYDKYKRDEILNKVLNSQCVRKPKYVEIANNLNEKGVETNDSFEIKYIKYSDNTECEYIIE